jgi:hypothetical protein
MKKIENTTIESFFEIQFNDRNETIIIENNNDINNDNDNDNKQTKLNIISWTIPFESNNDQNSLHLKISNYLQRKTLSEIENRNVIEINNNNLKSNQKFCLKSYRIEGNFNIYVNE